MKTKKASQIKVFNFVETEVGAKMVNEFLRNNSIINLSTNVENGHVMAIVVYAVEIVIPNTVEKEEEIEILDLNN